MITIKNEIKPIKCTLPVHTIKYFNGDIEELHESEGIRDYEPIKIKFSNEIDIFKWFENQNKHYIIDKKDFIVKTTDGKSFILKNCIPIEYDDINDETTILVETVQKT